MATYDDRVNEALQNHNLGKATPDSMRLLKTIPGFFSGTKKYSSNEVAEALRKPENTGAGRMGAGRGEQGGPTAEQLADYEDKQNSDIYTVSGKGPQPPMDPEGVRKKTKKMASGGKVSASSRGDGIAKRGKTKGRFV